MAQPNYFTCTLGQAAQYQETKSDYATISEFLDDQVLRVPKLPAVGFYRPLPGICNGGSRRFDAYNGGSIETRSNERKQWHHNILTFEDVLNGSLAVAGLLLQDETLRPNVDVGTGQRSHVERTVALLCPSSADFLFTWLALMRLGYGVLLIAPQCSASAIAHLCVDCKTNLLLYDKAYQELALASALQHGPQSGVEAKLMPVQDILSMKGVFQGPPQCHSVRPFEAPDYLSESSSIAYLHHTSGTSSGVPKPIPQSHQAAVGVLPHLDGSKHATFTTTPLYHGGVADLFRAWTSDAMIWQFPGKEVPITATNVVKCLDIARSCSEREQAPPVKYFSSVPYVLQMMAADERGLNHLQSMDIVGVGGAALPAEAGDNLVRKGLNLISRFGSAECGFLLSSHRDYKKDKEWQYLRSGTGAEPLRFSRQDDGLSELIIQPGWPHMAKKNREDGSYATADLFAPHSDVPNAWKYHSRADSQLTLTTGKKFDPAPLEAAIATSPILDDVLIFGNGEQYPGALLFRSIVAEDMANEELVAKLGPAIEKLNAESQSHARLPRNMLIPIPHSDCTLDKSSKGTVLRGRAEERYAKEIQGAYSSTTIADGAHASDEQLPAVITKIVENVVGKQEGLTTDTDLFCFGVDSVACVQIRFSLQQLLPDDKGPLPLTIVEDCGTIEKIVQMILAERHGLAVTDEAEEDPFQAMWGLVDRYGTLTGEGVTTSGLGSEGSSLLSSRTDQDNNREVVVLTGVTGALGAHILDAYRQSARKIYCLVRAADDHAAQERVRRALAFRQLAPVEPTAQNSAEIVILRAKLAEINLGLPTKVYAQLASEATVIVHVAWAVNFTISLPSFSSQLSGLRNLLDLALSAPGTPPNFLFCSSVASVANYVGSTVPEQIIADPAAASELGYSKSKWIAEQICHRAHLQTRLRGRIGVFRVGQLAGAERTGVWNMSEAYPLMLSSVMETGCLPEIRDELTWLPVDIAARAFVEAGYGMGDMEEMQVYHVVNDVRPAATWSALLSWLKRIEAFEVVPAQSWVRRLERLDPSHPATKLLSFWKKTYAQQRVDGVEKSTKRYAMEQMKRLAPIMASVQPVDEVYFVKLWGWIKEQSRDGYGL